MAQVFPLNVPAEARDPTLSSLLDTLTGLPDPWTLLAERAIGDTDRVGAVLVHPEIGVALIDVAPRDAGPAAAALGELLARERFAEFFPGELPIVAVSVAAEDIPGIGERLAEAFDAAPRLSIADRDWSDAVVELLLQPDDMAMAPAGGQTDAAIEGFAGPPFSSSVEPAPPPEPEAPAFTPAAAEDPVLPWGEDVDRDAPPLHADWRMAVSYPPPRRRGRLVAAAVAILLLGGAAGLGLAVEGGALPLPASVASRNHPVEVPLAPAEAGDQAGGAAAMAVPSPPPPVPAAPPVMLAAKPLVSPPPAAPKPTRVAALPPVPAPAPASPPRQTAETKPAPAPSPAAPPPTTESASAPAAAIAVKPKPRPAARPQPVVAAQHPPQRAPRPGAPAAVARPLRPPIDATDLPPLDEPAPNTPAAEASPPVAPPEASPPPPLPVAAAPAPTAPAIGPPRRLARNPSPTAPEMAGEQRECRPYTANSTLTGKGVAVQGIACRDSDGQWRLVSEVPLR